MATAGTVLFIAPSHLRMIRAVATGLPTLLLLLLFAAIYGPIARNDPDSFSEMLSRTDALYPPSPISPPSVQRHRPSKHRGMHSHDARMIMDLVAVGLIAKILLGAVDAAQQRHKNEVAAENNDSSGARWRDRPTVWPEV